MQKPILSQVTSTPGQTNVVATQNGESLRTTDNVLFKFNAGDILGKYQTARNGTSMPQFPNGELDFYVYSDASGVLFVVPQSITQLVN